MNYESLVSNWEQGVILFFLVVCRITPPLVFNSINPISMLPAYFKVVVTFTFSIIITLNIFSKDMLMKVSQYNGIDLAIAYATETFIGLTFWLALVVTNGAILTFLKLLDMQVGFNPMGIFNPSTQDNEPILTRAVIVFISLLFFITGAHYALIEVLAVSVYHYPVLSGFGEPNMGMMIAMFSSQLVLAFILALPVMIAIFWVDLLLGLCNRIMPQVNIYFVGLPAKTAVAFLVLGVSARHISEVADLLFNGVFDYWNALY